MSGLREQRQLCLLLLPLLSWATMATPVADSPSLRGSWDRGVSVVAEQGDLTSQPGTPVAVTPALATRSGIEAEVWASASSEAPELTEDARPATDGVSDLTFQRLAAGAFAASMVSLLLSVLAIGVLCRLLGAAQQMELIDAARLRASGESPVTTVTEIAPQPGSSGRRSSISFTNAPGASRSSKLQVPRAGVAASMQHRMSRHFEDFHGVPLEEGAAGKGSDASSKGTDFNGTWECVETWGLDQFLQGIKVGRVRRLAAMRAPWPTWELKQAGLDFTYINKSKFGTMTETFTADGSEYSHKDLEGNVSTCKATVKDGVSLVIERVGKQGRCWETRTIKDGDALDFQLEMEGIEAKWGRRFVRKPGSGKKGAR